MIPPVKNKSPVPSVRKVLGLPTRTFRRTLGRNLGLGGQNAQPITVFQDIVFVLGRSVDSEADHFTITRPVDVVEELLNRGSFLEHVGRSSVIHLIKEADSNFVHFRLLLPSSGKCIWQGSTKDGKE